MPKPSHLTWEEAAVNALCASTSYRMLVGQHAARMKQGDNVFIWGATGGIGAYATQLVLNGGGTPVGVVSSESRVKLLQAMGCEHVIDRRAEGYQFWSDEHTQDEGEWRRLGKKVRTPDRRGSRHRLRAPGPPDHGGIGVHHQARRHDRHLRGDIGLHARVRQPAPVDEAQAHRVEPLRQLPRGVGDEPPHRPGRHPAGPVARSSRLDDVGEAALKTHRNEGEGKLGVLCLAPEAGQGINDPEKRDRIGEDKITLFQRHARGEL